MVPATLKRGGNFIELEPSPNGNFAELDRIDFLRVIRDTIPANGFDNGIRVRLTADDEFAIKDGGYAIFENVVLDSLKDIGDVFLQVKNAYSGKIVIRDGKKDGTALFTCDLSNSSLVGGGWSVAKCSGDMGLRGIKDLYLTASGISGEAILGNLIFEPMRVVCNQEPCGDPISSSSGAEITSSSSGTTAIAPRAVRPDNTMVPARKGYRDLKGRSFDKQIPYRVMF
jgi:arabinan endo-1,5-alpha-L-arabinosidase